MVRFGSVFFGGDTLNNSLKRHEQQPSITFNIQIELCFPSEEDSKKGQELVVFVL